MTDSSRTPMWGLIIAVAVGGAFYLAGKNIETSNTPEPRGTITVSGDGRVFTMPDIAQVSFGIQTGRVQSADAAMEKLSTGMKKVLDAVKAEGVDDKDIQTESFYLNPVYDWTDNGQVFRGFEASQSVRVKVRELDKASDVLGAATSAGANQAGGVNFTVDDPDEKRAEARAMAIDEAKQKARELARQLGVSLGDITGFNENGGGYPVPMMMRSEAYGIGGGSDEAVKLATPLPAGEQEINVSVSITYEIK